MKDIYVLSVVIAMLVVLPIIILTVKYCLKTNKSRTVLITCYKSEEICDETISDIKSVWWEEHFCAAANGRPVVLVLENADDEFTNELSKKLDSIEVVRIENLLEYLRHEGQKQ